MNGGQQIVGGLLAYCFTLIHKGPVKSWQAIFITYGCFSVLYGVFVLWWLPDSPMRAKSFSEEDKHLMVERVRSNQTGLQNRTFKPEQVKEALLDLQTWCYCLIQFCTTLPTSGLWCVRQHHHYGIRLHGASDSAIGHGPRSLHHPRSAELDVACEEDWPEPADHGTLRDPIFHRDNRALDCNEH